MNRHLNVFHHYTQNGSIPIENNVSRGLAISLQEEPGLLFLMLNRIRNSGCNVADPENEYKVGFQVRCSELPEATTIIGISLTARELTDLVDDGSKTDGATDPVTDISICFDDTVIIIEVKRNENDCRTQLDDQIKKYKGFHNIHDDGISSSSVDMSWDKIMTIIKRYIQLQNGKASRLLSDYYEEITLQFPSWAPREPLSRLNPDEADRIRQRIDRIKHIYNKKFGQADLMYGRGAIPIDFEWASEYNVDFQQDFFNEKGLRGAYITFGVWPSDTCSQYWALKRKVKNLDFFNKRFETYTLIDGTEVKVRVLPYLKFCHFNRGVMWLFNLDSDENNVSALIKLADDITGKWKRDEWGDLKSKIANSGAFSNAKIDSFKDDFQDSFETTERNYVVVSLGFEVYAYLPYKEAQSMDAVFSNEESELVTYMKKVLDMIKAQIEK